MILNIEQFEKCPGQIGSKALQLKKLMDYGFNVPSFLVIPSEFFVNNTEADGHIKLESLGLLVKNIIKQLDSKQYAVRSAALTEDGKEESLAGQFMTMVAVDKNDLAGAIKKVTAHAYNYLNGNIGQFSIIIQKFIEPEFAGVTFTRSPLGGREISIESVSGRGEKLVGGFSNPQKYNFYWQEAPPLVLKLDAEDINNFKKIENHFQFPQDIEWCVKGGECHYLQTRPVTSLTDPAYRQILFLEDFLQKKNNYYYQKTEISEIASRPTPVTFGLLQKIYSTGGPVQSVYSKHKIKYNPRDFLEIIGNELYVNKEEELKTLFPAKSYFISQKLQPEFCRFQGIIRSFNNLLKFYRIKTSDYILWCDAIKERVNFDFSMVSNIRDWLAIFFDDYKIVFETNLLAGLALNHLQQTINGKDKIELSYLLSAGSDLLGDLQTEIKLDFKTDFLCGNSFDVADESEFVKNLSLETETPKPAREWIEKQNKIKRGVVLPVIRRAIIFNYLREYGRWLIVIRINHLRKILFSLARNNFLREERDIYYYSWDELLAGKMDGIDIFKRKNDYSRYNDFTLPNTIVNRFQSVGDKKTVGVSSGVATGELVDINSVDGEKKKILYTKILSPDLVKYFDKVQGIVAEGGGMLSHLSIIAREKKLPVVVNFNISQTDIKLGDYVQIDGGSGEINKLDK